MQRKIGIFVTKIVMFKAVNCSVALICDKEFMLHWVMQGKIAVLFRSCFCGILPFSLAVYCGVSFYGNEPAANFFMEMMLKELITGSDFDHVKCKQNGVFRGLDHNTSAPSCL
jgi:hypothetical protein